MLPIGTTRQEHEVRVFKIQRRNHLMPVSGPGLRRSDHPSSKTSSSTSNGASYFCRWTGSSGKRIISGEQFVLLRFWVSAFQTHFKGVRKSQSNTIHCVSDCISIKREHANLRCVAISIAAAVYPILINWNVDVIAPTGAVSISHLQTNNFWMTFRGKLTWQCCLFFVSLINTGPLRARILHYVQQFAETNLK